MASPQWSLQHDIAHGSIHPDVSVTLRVAEVSQLGQDRQCRTEVKGAAMDVVVGNLPELEGSDLVIAALVLHLPEHLVQVQLLVCKGGHLVLALGAPVPVDEQTCEGVLVQPTHQIQHFLSHIAIVGQEAWLVTVMLGRSRGQNARVCALQLARAPSKSNQHHLSK